MVETGDEFVGTLNKAGIQIIHCSDKAGPTCKPEEFLCSHHESLILAPCMAMTKTHGNWEI